MDGEREKNADILLGVSLFFGDFFKKNCLILDVDLWWLVGVEVEESNLKEDTDEDFVVE